jgi:TonB-linked SusC/RagA family outer membrane protein
MKQQLKRASMALLLSVVCFMAYAQKTVTGTVKDATGEPMIGVSVVVDGTSIGGVTDLDGNFTIQKVPNSGVLKFSYVGYKEQKVSVAGKNSLDIVLQEDAMGLDEVVVVGYGTMKKKDLTGAVASVKTDDIAQVAAPDALQAMQAKVPGVDLISGDGQAGSAVSITLRGNRSITASNSPLIIVDGVEYTGSLDIPASDIESMDILKDASSTAIYGTKGANGVIIITTKRGQAGKTRIYFSAYLAMKSPTSAVKSMYGQTEVRRWVDRANYQADLASGNWGTSNVSLDDVFGATTIAGNDKYKVVDLINNGDFTDWYDTILQNSTSQNYEASVSGGNDKTNFSLSLAAMYDKGLLKHDEMDRYNGRLNLDHIINQYFKVGGSLAFTYRSHNARNASVFNAARKMTSLTQAYKEDGSINETPNVWYSSHVNPLMDEGDNYKMHIESTRFMGSTYLQITPIKGLALKTQLAVDRRNRRVGQYNDYQSAGRYQAPSTTYMSNSWDAFTILTWQNTANYNITLDEKHDLGFLLGHELRQDVREGLGYNGTAGKEHYYNQEFYDVTKISADQTPSSNYTKQAMLSFFGRVNYTYMDRYLFSASLRADGSSVLAEGKKWGYFPSVSAGWRITEESFMEGTKSWLDNLKLRVAWGISGNAAVNPYQTLATVSATTPGSSDSFIPMSMSNEDLSWETTSSINIGIDFGIIGGRVNGTIDYYNTKTKDLLYYKSAPASSVFTSVLSNIGESKGQGLEIGVNALAVKTKDFTWDINASYTTQKDEIVKLADNLERNIDGTTALIVGEALSAYYDYETNGIWNVGEYEQYVADYQAKGIEFTAPLTKYGTPGTLKIVDQNGDGKINEDDKIVYKRTPSHILGLTNTFRYKNFALSLQCMARLGGYFAFDKNNALGLNDGDANWAEVDYWTPNNTGAKFPSPGTNDNELSKLYTQYASTLLYEKINFFKIKDITLSYNLEKKWLKPIHMESAKIYCSMKNYFTFASVDDYDPERGGSINWPLAKQVVVGVNVSF